MREHRLVEQAGVEPEDERRAFRGGLTEAGVLRAEHPQCAFGRGCAPRRRIGGQVAGAGGEFTLIRRHRARARALIEHIAPDEPLAREAGFRKRDIRAVPVQHMQKGVCVFHKINAPCQMISSPSASGSGGNGAAGGSWYQKATEAISSARLWKRPPERQPSA